jgi:hypothetical protein
MRCDSAYLIHGDAAGAWGKDEADSAGAAIRSVLRVGQAGCSADLDPHI